MGTNVRPSIVTDGLTLYLDAGNKLSTPNRNVSWNDISGNRAVASFVGPVFNSISLGAADYDGTSNFATIPASANYNFVLTPFSITAWVYKKSAARLVICNRGDTGNGTQETYAFDVDPTTNQLRMTLYDTSISNQSIITAPDPLPIGSWQHIVTTYTGTGGNLNLTLYQNGAQIRNPTLSSVGTFTQIRSASVPMYIGSFGSSGTSRYIGSDMFFAVLQIYSKALSAQEVLQNYNAHKARFGLA